MKKYFTLALVGALGLGAVAVAIPAAMSTSPVPAHAAAAAPSITPGGVTYSGFNSVWNPEVEGFDLEITLPTSGYYYDEDNNYQSTTLPYITKAVLLRQGKEYSDPKTEVHVWDNPEPGSTVTYTDIVDEKGRDYYYYVNIYVDDNVDSNYPTSLYAGSAMSLPEAPADVEYSTVEGQAPVTISFTAPSTFKGSEITLKKNIDKITLYTSEYNYSTWSYETTEWAVLSDVEPGTRQQFVVTEGLTEAKTYQFRIKATAYDGDSEAVNANVLIGKDRPSLPTNVVAKELADGNVLVTWDAVTKGAQGGYFVPEEVTYSVYRATNQYDSSPVLLSEDQSECSYTFDASELTDPTEIYFQVSARNSGGSTNTVTAPSIIAGPASTVPFVETFNNGTPDKLWTCYCPQYEYMRASVVNYVYVNGTQYYPVGDNGYMLGISYYSSHKGYVTYYTSSKIDVSGKSSLNLEFSLLRVPSSSGVVNAQIAFDGGEFATVASGDMTDGTTVEWTKHKGSVDVPADAKTAVMRLEFLAGDNPDYVCVDEISLREAGAAAIVYPASATDLKAVYDYDNNTMTVSFKAPSLTHHTLGDVNDEPLEAISRIELFRQIGYDDYTSVKTWDNPEVGKELSYIDTDLALGGEYRYKVLVYVDENCDFGAFMDESVMVGQIPADVTDLKGTSAQGKAPVTLTFTAPSVDSKGDELRAISEIKVLRKLSSDYTFDTTIKTLTDVTPGEEYSVVDNDVQEDCFYTYKVEVYGSAGNSYGSQIAIFVGDDTPVQPGNVLAAVNDDKSVTITWTAPERGVNNGFIDPENLTYTVLIAAPNSTYEYYATQLKSDITGTSYTYTPEPGDEQALRYFVKANNGSRTGQAALSNTIFVGNPAALPYVEKFNTKVTDYQLTFNHLWTTTSEGSSDNFNCAELAYMPGNIGQVAPVNSDGGLAYVYYGTYSSVEMDQYMTSGNIDVADAELAVVSFYYYAVAGYDTEISLGISFDGGEFWPFWSESFQEHMGEDGWQKVEIPVDVRLMKASTIQLQFHAHKGEYACSAVIDDVVVYDLPAPKLEVSGSTLSWTVEPNEYAELTGFRLFKVTDDGAELSQSIDAATTTVDATEEGTYCVSALYGNIETNYSNEVEVALQGVAPALAGSVTVKAEAGNIVVEGAEGLAVSICTVDGRVVYSAEGNASVAVVPGIYLVKVAGSTVKLSVR